LGFAESQREYELTGKRPKLGELKSRLVELKRDECPWLYEVSAHIGQSALKDLNVAFERFFKSVEGSGLKAGFPCFKRKGERDSARMYEVALEERHVRLPMIGWVRLKETRSDRGFEGRILSATIRRRADRWFVSLCVEREREQTPPRVVRHPSDVVGVDLGLKKAAVLHDGETVRLLEPAQALRRNLKKLRRLDRQLARKQRGSANRRKAKLRRQRLHYRISCQRNDYLHQLSSSLAKAKPVIVLEDLHVRGMQRNRHLALSIGDAGMGELRRQLGYKSEWYGSTLIVADRFFPSSKLCSGCGVIKDTLALAERVYDCSVCGTSLDRDENAASNLRAYGLNQLGIVPLPEGLREVTPDGEEGSGLSLSEPKPASVKQEASVNRRKPRRATQRRAETLAGVATGGTSPAHRNAAPPLWLSGPEAALEPGQPLPDPADEERPDHDAGNQQGQRHDGGNPGMIDGEQQNAHERRVLGEAERDVRHGLRRGVGRQTQARLRAVGRERRRASEHRSERLVEVPDLAGDERPDDGGERGPDRRVHEIPRAVDVGDLVDDELEPGQRCSDDEHVGALEHIRHVLEPSDAAGETGHEDGRIDADAARPSRGQDIREGVH
jgi:putative transposase